MLESADLALMGEGSDAQIIPHLGRVLIGEGVILVLVFLLIGALSMTPVLVRM